MSTLSTETAPGLDEARRHLCLALDMDDEDDAVALAGELRPWFAVVKVGYQLLLAAGPAVISRLGDAGFDVFADLKLHDIPNTVEKGARAVGRWGVSHLTVHTAGGPDVLSAAVAGLASTAPDAVALGVTVLTSDAHAPPDLVAARADAARRAGCGGVVCAVTDLPSVGGMRAVTPGIRLAGSGADDQARVSTPGAAIAAGADLLVVGRTVSGAADRRAAAAAVATEVAQALG
jgi:orotidine-5'-phosphate decarboxylase